MNHPLTREEFAEIYSKVPRLCLDLIVYRGYEVLFTRRSIEPAKGKWHLPGMTWQRGLSINEMAHLVAQAELGLQNIVEPHFMSIIDWINSQNTHFHTVSIVVATPYSGFDIRLNAEADEYCWFSSVNANMLEEHRKVFQRFGE